MDAGRTASAGTICRVIYAREAALLQRHVGDGQPGCRGGCVSRAPMCALQLWALRLRLLTTRGARGGRTRAAGARARLLQGWCSDTARRGTSDARCAPPPHASRRHAFVLGSPVVTRLCCGACIVSGSGGSYLRLRRDSGTPRLEQSHREECVRCAPSLAACGDAEDARGCRVRDTSFPLLSSAMMRYWAARHLRPSGTKAQDGALSASYGRMAKVTIISPRRSRATTLHSPGDADPTDGAPRAWPASERPKPHTAAFAAQACAAHPWRCAAALTSAVQRRCSAQRTRPVGLSPVRLCPSIAQPPEGWW
jgi:hypothetical protein